MLPTTMVAFAIATASTMTTRIAAAAFSLPPRMPVAAFSAAPSSVALSLAAACSARSEEFGGAVRRLGGGFGGVRTPSSSLSMVRNRGLEVREEGATPLPGGMTLYVKAGPDGTSPGDCPFAHYVRTVLHEKGLDYALIPSTAETKPQWLIDHYGAKMPALRHRKECYVESDVIAQYLDFFFRDPPLSNASKGDMAEANEACDGFFPALARYLKHVPDGDDEDDELRLGLEGSLAKLEDHLANEEREGPYLAGDGTEFTLVDASLAPKLYHMEVGLEAFKEGSIDLGRNFPRVRKYMDAAFERPSFKEACDYGKETIVWGWGQARGN